MSISGSLDAGRTLAPPAGSGRSWLALVFALILMNMGIVATTIYCATSDAHAGVEPDYYARALTYDRVIEQRAANARLGWRTEAALHTNSAAGVATLTVTISDREGNPVREAVVRAEAFASLRSSERRSVMLRQDNGAYAAVIPISAPGLWRVRLVVSRAADTFTSEHDIMLDGSGIGTGGETGRMIR